MGLFHWSIVVLYLGRTEICIYLPGESHMTDSLESRQLGPQSQGLLPTPAVMR